MKVLWYSDFLCYSGFGHVAMELVRRLRKLGDYEFTVVAINYDGEPYNYPASPFYEFRDIPVYPADYKGDYIGRTRFLEILSTQKFDAVFALQDTFNMASIEPMLRASKQLHNRTGPITPGETPPPELPYIFYFPVDGDLDPRWVESAVKVADVPVTYTHYGRREVRKHAPDLDVEVVYHGVDFDTFYPAEPSEREEIRKRHGLKPGDFLVTNVNRNQPRKDLPRTILAWLNARKLRPEVRWKLMLHCDYRDPAGQNLGQFIRRHVPEEWRADILKPWGEPGECSSELIREVYVASDVVVSTTLGEGWGLSTTEAMACKIPVIMPRHTACEEIVESRKYWGDRGWLVDCTSEYVLPHTDNGTVRPVVNLGEMAVAIAKATYPVAADRVSTAYDWVREHCDWNKIAERWHEIFQGVRG